MLLHPATATHCSQSFRISKGTKVVQKDTVIAPPLFQQKNGIRVAQQVQNLLVMELFDQRLRFQYQVWNTIFDHFIFGEKT